MVIEESDNATLIVLTKPRDCTGAECENFAHYALSVDDNPFEPLCRGHLPANCIQEYWAERMLLAAQDGNMKKARALLRHVTAEARYTGYDRCASIADVHVQDARNSTYSNKDMARGAEDMAQRIARSIRLAEGK